MTITAHDLAGGLTPADPHVGNERLDQIIRNHPDSGPENNAFIEGFIAGRYGTDHSEMALHWFMREGIGL